jgi:hypothetical protein
MRCLSSVVLGGENPPYIESVVIDGISILVGNVSLEETLLILSGHGDFTISEIDNNWIVNYNGTAKVEKIIYNGSEYAFRDAGCCDNCFEHLVALKDICEPKDCRLYINDLGIDRSYLEGIITKDFSNVKEFYLAQLRLAFNDISGMIHSWVQPKLSTVSSLYSGKTGFLESGSYHDTSTFQGFYVKLNQNNDYILTITQLKLITNYTGKVSVFGYDYQTGEMLTHTVIDCISGVYSTKKTNIVISRPIMLFLWKPAGKKTKKTQVATGMCCGKTQVKNNHYTIAGIKGDFGAFTETELTGGLGAEFSVECDFNAWICRNSNLLTLPMLYRTAIYIYQFALNTSKHHRTNTMVTINSETTESALAWATEQFNKSINGALQNMVVPDNGCFKCREFARSQLVMP